MATAIGIDIGRASATAVVLRRSGSSLAVQRFARLSLDELREQGVDVDSPGALAVAVAQKLKARGLSSAGANLGISGKDAIIRYAHLPPMPPWRLALVMKYDIADAAEKTGAALSSDWRTIGIGEDNGSVILVAMAKDERVTEWVRGFEKAGYHLGSASPRPTAVGDAFRFLGESATEGTILVFDVGRSSTEVALVSDGALLFARSVAQGGDMLTDRLAKRLQCSREEAEEYKIAGQGPKGEDLAPILEGGISQLASVARASLEFARSQLKNPTLKLDRIVVTGGGARTPGLVEAIGDASGVPTKLWDPIAGVDQDPLAPSDKAAADANGLEAAAACGLALAQLMPRAVSLDLLPNAVKAAREFRERTVWMYAAGAVACLYLVVAGSVGWLRSSGEAARRDELKKVRAVVDGRTAAKEDLAAENAARTKNLQTLAARARTSYSSAALIAALAREMPPRIAVGELSLVREKNAADQPGSESFHFELRGTADNSRRDALAALRKLEDALGRDPDVGEVKVSPGGADGPTVEFSLFVKPKA